MSVLGPAACGLSSDRDFRHDGLFYDDDEQLARVAAPFLRDGLAAGDPVVLTTSPHAARVLREAVGDHPLLHVLERNEAYRTRTPTAITTFRRLADEYTGEGVPRVRVVGEVDFGATERDWLEWQRYESVVNEAMADCPVWGLCLFDTQRLAPRLLETALATHSALVDPDGRAANPRFVDPADYLRGLPVPDEPLEGTPPRLDAPDVADFVGLRHAVARELTTAGGDDDLAADFGLAVDEMVSNAVRHGLPPVSLRLWTAEDRIVCTIGDGGPGWDDPFAGYGPAHGDDLSRGGMGLWLARQLCDHVDISGGPDGTGVRVRLTVRLR
ncbi:sensor histidine kinase [Blastococcus goldschmidtiae]|uniref:Sensor histidine kinase n=1 Tax=Blastococcus goldschmidtiae TaxID=3075546 RepID=A0ABU2K577_9ACTN|nr:sensor histidine kinase [Blastococcus sp. DSM 46792]MDT0275361.1 sensor histidine kinase [Blastococcus sp. DSM 46792]